MTPHATFIATIANLVVPKKAGHAMALFSETNAVSATCITHYASDMYAHVQLVSATLYITRFYSNIYILYIVNKIFLQIKKKEYRDCIYKKEKETRLGHE